MGASSALMRLLGNEVVGGGRKSMLSGLTKASTKMAEKEGANIAKKLVVDEISEKTPSVIRVFTKDSPMSLQEAYERTASMRNAHASNKRMLTEASGKELYKNFPNDFMELDNSNPYAKKLFGDYDNAISREIGSENASKLRNILGDYARLDNKDFEGSRNMVKNFLNSKDSDAVVNKSRDLLEDAGVYRAHNSPDGISWTTKPSVAMQYIDESLHPDGTKILEGEIHPNNRVIAPQFTERYQPALAQHEVIGDPSGIQQVGKTKMVELLKGEGVDTNDINVANALRYMKPKNGGNYGHKGVNGMRGGSAPKTQQPVDDMITLYHNTKAENIPSILEQGLVPGKRAEGYLASPEEAGIWTDDRGLTSGSYGGTTVKIRVPRKEFDATRVNDTQNLINRVIKPSEIEGVDYMLYDAPLIKTSNLQKFIDKYGEDKVRNLIERKGLVSPEVIEETFSGLGGSLPKVQYSMAEEDMPIRVYHSTPNEFDKFDDAMLGSNTGHENTKLGHFVTTDKEFSEKFLGDNGSGRTMELDANIKNPITHPYMAGLKYEGEELDNIVAKYLEATDNQELLQTLSEYAKENGTSLYDEYMDLTVGETSPFEFAEDERKLLQSKGYDAAEVIEGMRKDLLDSSTENVPVSSYAVFDSNNLKPVVADREPNVNYSLADETDVGLSPAQREFFKNSVVRDENGDLKEVFHGSASEPFYEFNKDMASPEGDWGKGFYTTDNYYDVTDNYSGGGPDLENKIERLAEQIQEYDNGTWEDAVERARNKLAKSDYTINAYMNMENPAVVGETTLFDGSEYPVRALSDYENLDDYYTDLIYDLSDDVIADTGIDYRWKDDIMRVLDEARWDGGIEIQNLKDNLNKLAIDDYDGNIVSNEVARSILENLGFDGVVDRTVSSKFRNMGIEPGTTHYIAFNPEQIKNVDNLNPTASPDIRYSKGDSLTDIANRIKAMQASRENMADGIKRIGSDEVAKVDESTLPYGWKYLEEYLDNADLDKELEKAIGKPYSEVTEGELREFLDKYGGDVAGDKRDLWDNAREVMYTSDMNEMYNRGYDPAGAFLEDRHPSSGSHLADATKFYIGDKGSTGRLDAEYSDRLGIGRSNTPMSDNLVSSRGNYKGAAAGDYGYGGIGISPKYSSGESGVSVLAHERMHAWQAAKSDGDWDDRVIDAIKELRDELKKYYHTDEELKKFHNIREGSDLDYYAEDIEQEARMLQSYLDNEGFTNTWRRRTGSTEWGDEVKPAFDKFYKKFRALSKAGVALPAIALLFGLSANGGEQKDKKA